MAHKIKISLSTHSIDEAIKQLNEIKAEIQYKNSILVQKLAEKGLKVIEANKYSRGDSDFSDLQTYVWVDDYGDKAKAVLVLAGKDVAFIEFGAGVHYNGSGGRNPDASKFGFTIGSYGKGQGVNDSWVYYDTEAARFKTSHGTEAAMPMHLARENILESFVSVANEVFGNG